MYHKSSQSIILCSKQTSSNNSSSLSCRVQCKPACSSICQPHSSLSCSDSSPLATRVVLILHSHYGRPMQYGLRSVTSLGHPCNKFQRVSCLAFVTAVTLLTGGQPNFARCLAISWAGILYIHFWGLLPHDEILPVKNSLYVQVLRSPILAALLHGTPAACVSQTLWRGTRNGITELLQRAPPVFGWAAITLGIGPHSSYSLFFRIFSISG